MVDNWLVWAYTVGIVKDKERQMQAKFINTEDAGQHKLAAYLNARMRSTVAATNYTDRQKIQIERMKQALELCYNAREVYVTFRKKFATIKLDSALAVRKQDIRELEAAWALAGVTKAVSLQGVIYRVPRQ
jgi:hypothetical protein